MVRTQCMVYRTAIIGLLCLAFCFGTKAQANISFMPLVAGGTLVLDSSYQLPNGQAFEVNTFRCYISAVQVFLGDSLVWAEPESYHLVDAAKPDTWHVAAPEGLVYDQIHFKLGTDSLTNVSGAMGGDLDPTKGMYWAWNSGYINMKLEGQYYDQNNAPTEFQYHLGGYAAPYATVQQLALAIDRLSSNVLVAIDLQAFLQQHYSTKAQHIMSPGKAAVQLSEQAAGMCYIIKQP